MGERLKEAGNLLLAILIFIAILVILALVIVGPEWLSERRLPGFVRASVLAFALLILVLLPLSACGRSRPFASVAILMVSYVFGATVWMEGLLLTMALWGTIAVVVGLFFAGVGVVPVAMLRRLRAA